MRIAIDARFLTHPQRGGFKTYTQNLVKALAEVDRRNEYLLYLDRQPGPDTDLVETDNFRYEVIQGTLPVVGTAWREQVSLRRRLRLDQPDLIHTLCNTAPIGLRGKWVLSLLDVIQVNEPQTLPSVRGYAGLKAWGITTYSRTTILAAARSAARIITLSHFEKKEILRTLGVRPDRVVVTHLAANGVFTPATEEAKARWRRELGERLGLPRRFVMAVGYEPRKNIPFVIDVFARLAQRHADLSLVLVAAHDERRAHFRQLARARDLENRIVFLGALAQAELAVLCNLAEVFVCPSERESFGLPPLEAMSCGTPTIALNSTSLPEIVEDGGILIDGRDTSEWADAISRVVSDEELRSTLSIRGLHRASKLSWRRCAEETVEVYRSVVEGG